MIYYIQVDGYNRFTDTFSRMNSFQTKQTKIRRLDRFMYVFNMLKLYIY